MGDIMDPLILMKYDEVMPLTVADLRRRTVLWLASSGPGYPSLMLQQGLCQLPPASTSAKPTQVMQRQFESTKTLPLIKDSG